MAKDVPHSQEYDSDLDAMSPEVRVALVETMRRNRTTFERLTLGEPACEQLLGNMLIELAEASADETKKWLELVRPIRDHMRGAL